MTMPRPMVPAPITPTFLMSSNEAMTVVLRLNLSGPIHYAKGLGVRMEKQGIGGIHAVNGVALPTNPYNPPRRSVGFPGSPLLKVVQCSDPDVVPYWQSLPVPCICLSYPPRPPVS